MEGYDTTVMLFPPFGAGTQLTQTPHGVVSAPVPSYTYDNVKDLSVVQGQHDTVVVFTARNGDQIESNLPYLIRHTPKPAAD